MPDDDEDSSVGGTSGGIGVSNDRRADNRRGVPPRRWRADQGGSAMTVRRT